MSTTEWLHHDDLPPVYFVNGEFSPCSMTNDAALLSVPSGQRLHMRARAFLYVTRDAGAGDRLDRLYVSVRLRDESRQQPHGKRQFVRARHVALRTVSAVARKSNIGKFGGTGFRRRAAVNDE
jgi:hypothetical protein